ncbi:MAG TPA: peptidoglycan-associated lipoprotein Pal [Burkholderiales bacterium]|nr:peptidoglycan-associated lipoprotein Pal [Burkholderiales bacterium]
MKTSLAALMITGLVAGCATQSNQESSPAPAPAPTAMSSTPSARSAPATSVAGVRSDGRAMPQARSVYYEYDRSEIKPEGAKVVDVNAQYLREHPELKVKVEGNADERGSREYNLALGQRRADAVGKRMTILGIPADRIETVSYGKEKPKATGHDESAWSENRRSDIVYR